MLIFFPDLSSLEKFEKRYGSVLKKDEKKTKKLQFIIIQFNSKKEQE